MKHRVTYAAKEKRRDQRRPVAIEGSIGGVRVGLADLSVAGVGGGTIALQDTPGAPLEANQRTVLEFTAATGRSVRIPVTIERLDHAAGAFGATFAELSDEDFAAIEKLMFPRRTTQI